MSADATVVMEHRHFVQASLQYVFLLQEVQERKKFEFVETLLGFMYGWLTFYHQGHEVANEFKPYMRELQLKLQKVTVSCLSTLTITQDRTKMSVPYSCARPIAWLIQARLLPFIVNRVHISGHRKVWLCRQRENAEKKVVSPVGCHWLRHEDSCNILRAMFDVTGMFSWVSDQETAVGEDKHAHDEMNQDEHHHSKKHEDQKVETRDNFNATRDITESYMRKMLEVRPMVNK
uniref:BAR domain-containing protein n=1 Tax=Timema shepardi TaxID=629360 RepID=A0A7R9BBX1_TIMSH|nr:unnamed protein product [Timema shepardi]